MNKYMKMEEKAAL